MTVIKINRFEEHTKIISALCRAHTLFDILTAGVLISCIIILYILSWFFRRKELCKQLYRKTCCTKTKINKPYRSNVMYDDVSTQTLYILFLLRLDCNNIIILYYLNRNKCDGAPRLYNNNCSE